MTTVSICCANPILSRGLQSVISDDFAVLGVFVSIDDLKEQIPAVYPDLLVVQMGPSLDLETLREIGVLAPALGIVIWADRILPEFVSQCLSIGIRGLISTTRSPETHVRCLKEVAAGNLWIDHELTKGLLSVRQVSLTPRERQLMGLLAQGLKNKEIAWRLGIAEGTVKVYLSKLFPKVGASDRFELALVALKNLFGTPGAEAQSGTGSAAPMPFPITLRILPKVTALPIQVDRRPQLAIGITEFNDPQRRCA